MCQLLIGNLTQNVNISRFSNEYHISMLQLLGTKSYFNTFN